MIRRIFYSIFNWKSILYKHYQLFFVPGYRAWILYPGSTIYKNIKYIFIFTIIDII